MTTWLAQLVSPHLRAALARARRAERIQAEATREMAREIVTERAATEAAIHRATEAEAALDEYRRVITELTRQYRERCRDADRATTALNAARKVIDELHAEPSWHPMSPPIDDGGWRKRAQDAERACRELTERLAAYEGRPLQDQLPPVAVGPNI